MNTEDFVTYEQAVKLKELGFNWGCQRHYIKKECNVKSKYNVTSSYYNYNKFNGTISAPTLAQVAKWLREVKGVYVVVEPLFSNYKLIGYDWIVYDDCSGYYTLRAPLPFSQTYESALSAGIDEALKLIERK